LPPAALEYVSPAAARLYRDMLPGWPDAPGWSVWRPLALDPYATWTQIGRLSIAFAVFTAIVAYPWRSDAFDEDPRSQVLARLALTRPGAGVLFGVLALVQQIAGMGRILWISDEPVRGGRASGPFVNPNHLAAWLEMVIPAALAYTLTLAGRIRRRIVAAA